MSSVLKLDLESKIQYLFRDLDIHGDYEKFQEHSMPLTLSFYRGDLHIRYYTVIKPLFSGNRFFLNRSQGRTKTRKSRQIHGNANPYISRKVHSSPLHQEILVHRSFLHTCSVPRISLLLDAEGVSFSDDAVGSRSPAPLLKGRHGGDMPVC